MMEAKFTKGPWGIEDPLGPEIMSIVANPDGEAYEWTFVAQVTADDDNTEAQGISFAEAQANAALIRAAPDLYEALQYITRWLMTDVDALPPHVTRDDVRVYHLDGAVLHNCLERARAALLRASPTEEPALPPQAQAASDLQPQE